jgi:DNA-binding NarL/FixJ family response regulator
LTVTIVSAAGALSEGLVAQQPGLVVFDLADRAFSFTDTYQLVRETVPTARVLAFYPHVRAELGEMARTAGCDLVMPRSRFLMNVAGALRAALPGDTP